MFFALQETVKLDVCSVFPCLSKFTQELCSATVRLLFEEGNIRWDPVAFGFRFSVVIANRLQLPPWTLFEAIFLSFMVLVFKGYTDSFSSRASVSSHSTATFRRYKESYRYSPEEGKSTNSGVSKGFPC